METANTFIDELHRLEEAAFLANDEEMLQDVREVLDRTVTDESLGITKGE